MDDLDVDAVIGEIMADVDRDKILRDTSEDQKLVHFI